MIVYYLTLCKYCTMQGGKILSLNQYKIPDMDKIWKNTANLDMSVLIQLCILMQSVLCKLFCTDNIFHFISWIMAIYIPQCSHIEWLAVVYSLSEYFLFAKCLVGEMSLGEMSLGGMSIGVMSLGEMSGRRYTWLLGKMSVGETSVREMS